MRFEFLDSAERRVLPPTDVPITSQDLAAAGLVRGQSLNFLQRFLNASRYPNVAKVRVTLFDPEGSDSALSGAALTAVNSAATVSAASYQAEGLTTEGIASLFGSELALMSQEATSLPLPTALQGTQVRVKDSAGVERIAPLFYVSPQQINFQIPAGTAVGTEAVMVFNGMGKLSTGTALINATGPGVFSANADGKGVVAGALLRVAANGTRRSNSTAQWDAGAKKYVAKPIVMGSEQIYLELYGTG